MYEYLNVEENELKREEESMIRKMVPTLQLLYQENRVTSMPSLIFMNGFLEEFYGKKELFENPNFKARAKIVDILEIVKDDFDKFSNYRNNPKFIVYLYDYFKNKKFITIETFEGKQPRKKPVDELYIALTELGVEKLLNLENEDFSSKLASGFDAYKETYIDKYSFVKKENIKYISHDTEKIKVVLESIFKEVSPSIEKSYRDVYYGYIEKAKEYVSLNDEEQYEFRKDYSSSEIIPFFKSVLVHDFSTNTYTLKDSYKIENIIKKIIEARLEEDLIEFVWTTALKVATIIKGRDYTIEVSIDTSFPRYVYIHLSDGAKFTLKTQIVHVINNYGTMFFRKPSTFHDVYYSDGTKMISPSYQKLVEEL